MTETADTTEDRCRYPIAYRIILAIAQTATVALTWTLWEAREYPPLLPLLAVPQFDMRLPMLASIAVSCAWPRIGIPIQAVVLAWSIVSDQSRMQPYMLSMLYLSCGTIPASPGGLLLARASLVSLWFFSGLHKLTSPAFFTTIVPWILSSLGLPASSGMAFLCGTCIGGSEVALAIACLVPGLRQGVAYGAFGIHALIAVLLSPLCLNWNCEVLPWNAVLAVSGTALMTNWHDAIPGVTWRRSATAARFAAVLLLLSPAGYWVGLVDAPLAHCLYAANTPTAFLCTPFSRRDLQMTCVETGYMLPPVRRLYEPFFLGAGRSGEWMEIEDPRWVAAWLGWAPRKVFWRDLVPDDSAIVPVIVSGTAADQGRDGQ